VPGPGTAAVGAHGAHPSWLQGVGGGVIIGENVSEASLWVAREEIRAGFSSFVFEPDFN